MNAAANCDRVTKCRFVPPSSLSLLFDDRREVTIDLATTLGIKPSDYVFSTVRVSESSTSVLVDSADGEAVELDATTLLALADPMYAQALQREAKESLGPIDDVVALSSFVSER